MLPVSIDLRMTLYAAYVSKLIMNGAKYTWVHIFFQMYLGTYLIPTTTDWSDGELHCTNKDIYDLCWQ